MRYAFLLPDIEYDVEKDAKDHDFRNITCSEWDRLFLPLWGHFSSRTLANRRTTQGCFAYNNHSLAFNRVEAQSSQFGEKN